MPRGALRRLNCGYRAGTKLAGAKWLPSRGSRGQPPGARFQRYFAQVDRLLQTRMKTYRIGGKSISPMPAIQWFRRRSRRGSWVASLHDVFSAPQHTTPVETGPPAYSSTPEYTSGGAHYLSPADYAMITTSVRCISRRTRRWSDDRDCRGARTSRSPTCQLPQHLWPARQRSGLDPNGSTDPGSFGDQRCRRGDARHRVVRSSGEKRTVDFVTSASTATSDGVFLSAQYVVNHNLAPVMSVSYGLCEADLGSSANSFLNSLWEQAAAEGITVLVSAGDSGAAGCDSPARPRRPTGAA